MVARSIELLTRISFSRMAALKITTWGLYLLERIRDIRIRQSVDLATSRDEKRKSLEFPKSFFSSIRRFFLLAIPQTECPRLISSTVSALPIPEETPVIKNFLMESNKFK